MRTIENAGLHPVGERRTIGNEKGRRLYAGAPKTFATLLASGAGQRSDGTTTTSKENQIVSEHIAEGGPSKPSKPEWLTSAEAALALGLTPDTLRSYRTPSRRRGPPFVKFGHGVMYRRQDVEAYLSSQGEA